MMAALIHQLRTPRKKIHRKKRQRFGEPKIDFSFTAREKNAYFRKNALYHEGGGMSPSS